MDCENGIFGPNYTPMYKYIVHCTKTALTKIVLHRKCSQKYWKIAHCLETTYVYNMQHAVCFSCMHGILSFDIFTQEIT